VGNIQPKAETQTQRIYIGASTVQVLELDGVIFADNLPDPIHVPLALMISVQEVQLSLEKFLGLVTQDE